MMSIIRYRTWLNTGLNCIQPLFDHRNIRRSISNPQAMTFIIVRVVAHNLYPQILINPSDIKNNSARHTLVFFHSCRANDIHPNYKRYESLRMLYIHCHYSSMLGISARDLCATIGTMLNCSYWPSQWHSHSRSHSHSHKHCHSHSHSH